jgi:hypothetical protein
MRPPMRTAPNPTRVKTLQLSPDEREKRRQLSLLFCTTPDLYVPSLIFYVFEKFSFVSSCSLFIIFRRYVFTASFISSKSCNFG